MAEEPSESSSAISEGSLTLEANKSVSCKLGFSIKFLFQFFHTFK